MALVALPQIETGYVKADRIVTGQELDMRLGRINSGRPREEIPRDIPPIYGRERMENTCKDETDT